MNNLYILNETFSNGYKIEILYLFFFASLLSGILVITSKNPIVSVLFLITLFLSIACYLITLGLDFIGLSYLLVYVGAVSILFLFILMLINVRVSELLSDTSNSIPIAAVITVSFIYVMSNILPYNISILNHNLIYNLVSDIFNDNYKDANIKENIYFVSTASWDSNLAEHSHITSIGNVLYTNYSLWLIITSIILLLAMIGAIVITIKPKPLKT